MVYKKRLKINSVHDRERKVIQISWYEEVGSILTPTNEMKLAVAESDATSSKSLCIDFETVGKRSRCLRHFFTKLRTAAEKPRGQKSPCRNT